MIDERIAAVLPLPPGHTLIIGMDPGANPDEGASVATEAGRVLGNDRVIVVSAPRVAVIPTSIIDIVETIIDQVTDRLTIDGVTVLRATIEDAAMNAARLIVARIDGYQVRP